MSVSKKIIQFYLQKGQADYAGEAVSQYEHAIQAAYFATKASATPEEICAALLHDMGHLVDANADSDRMGEWGVRNHELVGAELLKKFRFKKKVCDLVGSHVQAKRYLTGKFPNYHKNLSEASRETLKWQGGPMGPDEIKSFELNPLAREILRLRQWDEKAKVVGLKVPGIETYEELLDSMIEPDPLKENLFSL